MHAPRHPHARAPSHVQRAYTWPAVARRAGGCGYPRPVVRPQTPSPGQRPPRPGHPSRPHAGRAQRLLLTGTRAPSHTGGAALGLSSPPPQLGWSGRRGVGDGGEGAPRECPATLTTTASLSATDPAIFLQSPAGCTAGGRVAGDVGRVARAGIPGRSCAGRGRGSETGSGARTHAGTRARTPGAPAPTWLAGPGGGGGEGRERRRRPGGRRWPLLPRPRLPSRSRAAFCLGVLLSLLQEERWQRPHGAGPGRHLRPPASGRETGNRAGTRLGCHGLLGVPCPSAIGRWQEAGAGGPGLPG